MIIRMYPHLFISFWITVLSILSCVVPLYAAPADGQAEVYLNNGDRISGRIVSDEGQRLKLESPVIGSVEVPRGEIKEILYAKSVTASAVKEKEKPAKWTRSISAGYNKSNGNTKSSNFSVRLLVDRKTDADDFSMKSDVYYSSANNKMDAQKWSGMLRYAYRFREKSWYNFYKIENDHDRFANIEYRIIPSTGLGYWFFDTPGFKALAEFGVGFEHTRFRKEEPDQNETVLIPRAFLEKKVFSRSKVTQDISVYPSLTESGEYRLHSETSLVNPLNEKLSLCFSFIDDYYSDPAEPAKENDSRFISTLRYSF